MTEILPFFFLVFRMQLMNVLLYARFLRWRLQCHDNVVFRFKFQVAFDLFGELFFSEV